MENFKLDARQVRCAMNLQAKNDVRYYLNGLLIGDGKIVATDGHRMAVVDSEEADFEPIIIQIRGSLLKSALECEFVFLEEDNGIVRTKGRDGQEQDKVLKFCIVEGKFPNWERVVPTEGKVEASEVGFNIGYLADIHKAAQDLGNNASIGKLTFFGKPERITGVIEVNTPCNYAKFITMSARI